MKHVDTMREQSREALEKQLRHSLAYGVALLAIIFLSFALRVYRLDGQSLWYDEGVTAQVASQGLAELTLWTAGDIQPPLYYYLLAGWLRPAGQSEWALGICERDHRPRRAGGNGARRRPGALAAALPGDAGRACAAGRRRRASIRQMTRIVV